MCFGFSLEKIALLNVQGDPRAERVGSEDWFGSFFSSWGESEGAGVGHLSVSTSKSFFGVSRAATLNPKTTSAHAPRSDRSQVERLALETTSRMWSIFQMFIFCRALTMCHGRAQP